jgi:uncharacterized protein (DUF4415 family)
MSACWHNDLLEWFLQQRCYQMLINATLRAFMNANTAH